jgi:hypothetical protein
LLGRNQLAAMVASAIVCGGIAFQASGQTINLTDANSVVQVSTSSSAGMFNWLVDGVDPLVQQWFWFRVGGAGGEAPINTISAPTITTPDAKTLYTRYNNGAFGVEVDYVLTGFSIGSGKSQLNESITITNGTGSPLDFHLFQYSDFDLSGSDGVLLSRNIPDNLWQKAIQTNSSGGSLSEQVTIAPHANRAQASLFPVLLNSLNDGGPTTLNDVAGAGPGDATWAFQWDFTIDPFSSLGISKLKTLQVPEPSIVALVFAGVAGLALRSRWQGRK